MKNQSNMMMMKKSPWPMAISMNSMTMMMNLTKNLEKKNNSSIMILTMMVMTWISMKWSMNSNLEKKMLGMISPSMIKSMKMSMLTLIMSEMMLFATFFYLNSSTKYFNNINMNLTLKKNMMKLNTMLATMNLIILLTSSMTLMMFINKNKKNMQSNKFMGMTLMLSMYFMLIQMIEFKTMKMNMTNSMSMSNFFMLTSFHMMHVIMGTTMMYLNMINKTQMMNNKNKLMMTCWYWHFVDTVWIFIFNLIY